MSDQGYDRTVDFLSTLHPGTEFIDGYFFDEKTISKKMGYHYKDGKKIINKLLNNGIIEKNIRDGVYQTKRYS